MKKIMIAASVLTASLIFTACGSGGSSSGATGATGTKAPSDTPPSQATSKVVPLNIGEATPVKAGYSIVDSNDEAVLDILVAGETKTVTLKSGVASIKMPI